MLAESDAPTQQRPTWARRKGAAGLGMRLRPPTPAGSSSRPARIQTYKQQLLVESFGLTASRLGARGHGALSLTGQYRYRQTDIPIRRSIHIPQAYTICRDTSRSVLRPTTWLLPLGHDRPASPPRVIDSSLAGKQIRSLTGGGRGGNTSLKHLRRSASLARTSFLIV